MVLNCLLKRDMKAIVILIFTLTQAMSMHLDPERIAARLRIEQEIANDKLAVSRNRRQLGGTPKEETIQVNYSCFIIF